jgi:hypothetical protein
MATHDSSKFRTTETYVSGAVCGELWWPVGHLSGTPMRAELRSYWDRIEAETFREALDRVLMDKGADFQGASFTEDTTITVVRRRIEGPGKYSNHVWARPVSALPDCDELVRRDVYVSDFMGED